MWVRLIDGVEPEIVGEIEQALRDHVRSFGDAVIQIAPMNKM